MVNIYVLANQSEHQMELREALQEEYSVECYTTCEEIKQAIEKKLPNLLLIKNDIKDSFLIDMLEEIKKDENLGHIPTIVISSGEDEELERKYLQIEIEDFIFTPCSRVGILSRTRRVLEVEGLKKHARVEIKKRIAEVDKMRNMACKDSLTKLWNRAHTEEVINEYLLERRHNGALIMIDLDNFKQINDTYGHIVGDEVLKEFGSTLSGLTRENDVVCRLGGDEFVVFLKDVAYQSVVSEKVEQLIMILEKRIVLPDSEQKITVSAGVALAPMDGRNFNQLYQNADRALYYVKQNGKGSYHFFSEEGIRDMNSEKKRSTQVDLNHLRSFIQEMGYKKGAYQVEYDGFKKIYRFVARCIGRTGQDVQTVLFTLSNEAGDVPESTELKFAMDNLKSAVHESIRRGDVTTGYSSSQLLMILMDSSIEDGEMVANRIVERYNQIQGYSQGIELHFDIQTVNAAPVSDDF